MIPIRWWHRIKIDPKTKHKNHITYPSKPFLRLSGLHFHPRAEFAVLSSVSRERVVKRDRRVSHIEYSSKERRREMKNPIQNVWGQKERVKIYIETRRERETLIKKCATPPRRVFSPLLLLPPRSPSFSLSLWCGRARFCAPFFSSLKIKRGFFVWGV